MTRLQNDSTVLIDSSLLIEMQKRTRFSEPVKQALSAFRFRGISSYSTLECKRAWRRRYCILHRYCREKDVKCIEDVFDKVNRSISSQSQRAGKTCLSILEKIVFRPDVRKLPPKALLKRTEIILKQQALGIEKALSKLHDHEFDGTGCVRARLELREAENGGLVDHIPTCKTSKIQCQVHRFFDTNKHEFGKIASQIENADNSSKEAKTIAATIRSSESNSMQLCDSKVCKRIADAIIAVDGADMKTLAANNNAEWVHISNAVGKDLINPVRKTNNSPSTSAPVAQAEEDGNSAGGDI